MNVYELKKKFDPDTGKPDGNKRVIVGTCCDYCGRLQKDEDFFPDPTYRVIESGGMEPQWHEMKCIIGNKKIDLYGLYNTHKNFVYCQDWMSDFFCERFLLLEFWSLLYGLDHKDPVIVDSIQHVQKFLDEENLGKLISVPRIWCHAMYEARHRVIQKLVSTGTYSIDQLGLEFLEL